MKSFTKKPKKNSLLPANPKKRIKKPVSGRKKMGSKLNNYSKCDGKSPKKFVSSKSEDEESIENSASSESEDEVDSPVRFESSGSEDELESSEKSASSESDDEEDSVEKFHKPPESLEVASDDSDYEDEEAVPQASGKITIQMVNKWENDLNANKRSMKPVATVIHAFHGCLIRITGEVSAKDAGGYRVDGSSVFNAVIRLCVTSLYPYLSKVMNLPATSVSKKHVANSKRWSTAKNIVRVYITDLIKLIGNVTSEDILRVLLKHLHQMMPFAACLPTISKPIIKQLIKLWSSNNDDTVRVISFLCILRYAASDLSMYLHTILKKMYVSYVTNCKFISQNSIPAVNFMRKSLTELFSLNETITYNHAFLYIRQLAIHLRSATILNKKDSIQTVYNWQFISSLRLWINVLCNMQEKQQLNALIYPTVQIIIGCMKLIPTAQYFPLRFHCIRMLIKLSKETGIFIPVLPFLIEALSILHVQAQHKKLSMRPMDFTYILRLSKSQLQENAFKDAVIENIYDCLLEYTTAESYRISFPDTVILLQAQMKQFLKDCKNVNYTRKLKPLLEKIEEVSKMVNEERKRCGIPLSDAKVIAAWESNMKLKSNSLMNYYESWRKLQEQKTARKSADKIELAEYELPVLKKLPGKKDQPKKSDKKSGDRVVLFASDSEDDDKEEEKLDTKQKPALNSRRRKIKKPKSQPCAKKRKSEVHEEDNESKDVVEDFNLSEFLS